MKIYLYSLLLAGVLLACGGDHADPEPTPEKPVVYRPNADAILARLHDADGSDVLVAVHRATCGDAPENSLTGIQQCMDMGVDMVELDVRRTHDGALVLMHDATIDRTTSGHGDVSALTLAAIRKFYLRNPAGALTSAQVPTLGEALQLIKGKVLIRVDKAYDIVDAVVAVLKETETLHQAAFVIPKDYNAARVKADWGEYLAAILLIPTLEADNNTASSAAADYHHQSTSVAFEMSFTYETTPALASFAAIRQQGARIMVYTGSAATCGGHDDKAAETNAAFSYGWLIDRQVNFIQTGRPDLLLPYLRQNKLHE